MNIRTYKITKTDLKTLSAKFYLEKKAYYRYNGYDMFEVSNVFLSRKDLTYYENCVRKKYKKLGYSGKLLNQYVSMELLNNSPSERLAHVLQPGWCIVIDERHGR